MRRKLDDGRKMKEVRKMEEEEGSWKGLIFTPSHLSKRKD